MYQVGITGNMGCGKSTVCKLLALLGHVPIYDADREAKVMMQDDAIIKSALIELFGQDAYLPDQTLNRKLIGASAFQDPEKLTMLNAIVHPASIARYNQWLNQQTALFTVKEAALLIEATNWQSLDAIIVVTAPEAIRLARVKQRDPERSEDQILKIFANQMPEDDKVRKAHYVINNDGKTAIIPQVRFVFKALTTAAQQLALTKHLS